MMVRFTISFDAGLAEEFDRLIHARAERLMTVRDMHDGALNPASADEVQYPHPQDEDLELAHLHAMPHRHTRSKF